MLFPSSSIEYVTWPVTSNLPLNGAPSFAFIPADARPDETTVWTAAQWEDEETTDYSGVHRTARLLVRGPDAPDEPAAAPIGSGVNGVWIRITDTPEQIVRQAGTIRVQ